MSVVGVLFLPYSARGHVSPMLTVAAELVDRGLPVRVIAGSGYRRAIGEAGAQAVIPAVDHEVRVPAGHRWGEFVDRGRLWRQRGIAGAAVCRSLEDELLHDRPDVCVVDPHIRWGAGAVARHGIPVVPLWTTHARTARPRGPMLVNSLPELQPRRARFGPDVHFVGPLSEGAHSCPAGITPARRQRRTLVVAVGTVFARSVDFFRNIVEVFTDSEWTVILATGWLPVEQLGSVPPNVYAHQWIPQSSVLRGADVFLTHGGMNSVHEAILAGVPMILAPRSREQRRTAANLYRLGVAEPLGSWKSLESCAARLAAGSETAERIGQLRARASSADGVVRAADVLTGMVAAARRSWIGRPCP